ncbi:MAG: hypothetical protein ACRDNF_25275 [Streptosporangiaceae bacterium]
MTGGASDGGTAWRDAPPAWWVRVGRVAGAGLTGVGVGAAVAGIWHAGMAGANSSCQDAGNNLCLDFVGPMVAAIAGNMIVIIAGVLIGFGAPRIRPLRLTVPAGFIVVVLLAWNVSVGTGGAGTGPPGWAAAVAVGSGLAVLALSVDWGRPQKAGIIALGAIIVASIIVPHVI